MSTVTRSVLEKLRRRVMAGSVLGEVSLQLTGALLIGGTLGLLLRWVGAFSASQAAWALAPAALVPALAYWRARPRFLSPAAAAAWLDVRAGGTGLVVTELELEDERWEARAREVLARAPHPPALRWPPLLGRPTFAGLYAAACLLVPITRPTIQAPGNLHEAALEALREKLETLEEEVQLDEELAEEITAQLERLDPDADDGPDAETAFEALDQLADRLDDEALEAQQAVEEALEQLDQLASSAPTDLEAGLENFEELVRALADSGLLEGLPEELAEALSAALDSGELPEGLELDLAELSELSAELAEALGDKLGRLTEAGLLEPSERSLPGDFATLEDFDFEEAVAGSGRPGQGGVDRGRADAQLTWGEETAGATDQFEPRVLPEAEYLDLEQSGVLGVGLRAPEVDARSEAGGSQGAGTSRGAATWRRRLAPRHRRAVGTFFGPSAGGE